MYIYSRTNMIIKKIEKIYTSYIIIISYVILKPDPFGQTHGPQLQELQLSAENVAGESGEPFATRKFHGDVGGNTPKWMVKIMGKP